MVLDAAADDRRDRAAIGVADQQPAPETDGIEHTREDVARFGVP